MSGGHKRGLGGMFGKESGTDNYEVYLNLTPLMDVMSNILFFLLAAFGATVVAVLPTTVPVKSSDSSGPTDTEEKVSVNVRAELGKGLTLNCESPTVDPAALKEFGAKLPMKNGDFDYEGLTAVVKRIKERYPASKNMVLVPDDEMPYEVIVKIMDAARDYKVPSGHRIEMFPEVVLSGIVK